MYEVLRKLFSMVDEETANKIEAAISGVHIETQKPSISESTITRSVTMEVIGIIMDYDRRIIVDDNKQTTLKIEVNQEDEYFEIFLGDTPICYYHPKTLLKFIDKLIDIL